MDITKPMKLNHQKSVKNYKTIQAKWQIIGENITKQIKAEFMQNRKKGKNITKPIESKLLTAYYKTQNEMKLKTPDDQTNQPQNVCSPKMPFLQNEYNVVSSL